MIRTVRVQIGDDVHLVDVAEPDEQPNEEKEAEREERRQSPKPDSYYLGTKCWRDHCGHARGEHDEAGCRGGEDTICRCTEFVEPVEDCPGVGKNVQDSPEPPSEDFDDSEEAEREERRQTREWRNDSGV